MQNLQPFAYDWTGTNNGQLGDPVATMVAAQCQECHRTAVYLVGDPEELVYPILGFGPEPSIHLTAEALSDYEEARAVANASPRAAAALLRLAVQRLCAAIVGDGRKLSDAIAELRRRGLPDEVCKALDAVRVIGNNAVHPGELDFRDNPQVVESLFRLVNIVAERMIGEPKQIAEIFGALPEGAKAAIGRRDGKT